MRNWGSSCIKKELFSWRGNENATLWCCSPRHRNRSAVRSRARVNAASDPNMPLLKVGLVWYTVLATARLQATWQRALPQWLVGRRETDHAEANAQWPCNSDAPDALVDLEAPQLMLLWQIAPFSPRSKQEDPEAALWARAGALGLCAILPADWDVHWSFVTPNCKTAS
jgi:hypothetical protein